VGSKEGATSSNRAGAPGGRGSGRRLKEEARKVASEEAEKVTAHHEAGHMVVAWELGLAVIGATIVPNPEEGCAGHVKVPIEGRIRYAAWVDEGEYLRAHVETYYAGVAASELYTGVPMSDAEVQAALESYGSDHYKVGDLVLLIAGPEADDQVELSEAAQRHARNVLYVRWPHVKAIASVLLERKTLDEGECRQVLESAGIV
jgi:hypothetical protein